MKVLAIDYGTRRVGLAIGDTEVNLALPHGVIERTSDAELLTRLREIVAEEEIDLVIVGEPVTLSGTSSAQTKTSRAFADLLSAGLAVKVTLMDERLTSQRADAVTLGAAAPTRSRDELAAMFLLQDYLERQANNV